MLGVEKEMMTPPLHLRKKGGKSDRAKHLKMLEKITIIYDPLTTSETKPRDPPPNLSE